MKVWLQRFLKILTSTRLRVRDAIWHLNLIWDFPPFPSVSFLLSHFPVEQPFTFSITTRSQAARAAAHSAAAAETGLLLLLSLPMFLLLLSSFPLLPLVSFSIIRLGQKLIEPFYLILLLVQTDVLVLYTISNDYRQWISERYWMMIEWKVKWILVSEM